MHAPKQPFQIKNIYILLLVYGGASLFHFAHNALFLEDYPNMSVTITPLKVIAAWLAITGVGIMGYLLMRRGHPFPALALFVVYGALGLDGLAHYNLAPMSDHTFTMNLSIWLEVSSAVVVLIALAGWMIKRWNRFA